MYKNLDIITW